MLSSNVLSQVFIVKCYSKSLLLRIYLTESNARSYKVPTFHKNLSRLGVTGLKVVMKGNIFGEFSGVASLEQAS